MKARDKINGDSDHVIIGDNPSVSLRRYWDIISFQHRIDILNESQIIDCFASNYLELADLLEKWCQLPWSELPLKMRGELGRCFGMSTKHAREWAEGQAPSLRGAAHELMGLNPLKGSLI